MPDYSFPKLTDSEECERYRRKLYQSARSLSQTIEDMDRMGNTTWSSKVLEKEADNIRIIATLGPEVLKAIYHISLAFQRETWDASQR